MNKKNLTAEVAEHAEDEMAKYSGPGCNEKSSPLFNPSRRINTAHGLPRNDFCDLRLLFVHPLLLFPGGSKGKKKSRFIE
jgi:hypothetical protein